MTARAFFLLGLMTVIPLAVASTSGPDTARDDVQTVQAGEDATSIAVLSDAVGNVTAIYGSDAADEEDTIFARRYPAGGPVADEPVALDTLTGDESRSDTSAAMDADGNLILVWSGAVTALAERRLIAQRFNADLTPRGDRIILAPAAQDISDVAMNAGGEFVVIWTVDNGSIEGSQRVQRFNAAGQATSETFTLVDDDNTFISDAAISPSGAFVVSYIGGRNETNAIERVFFQLFNTQGERVVNGARANTDDIDMFRTTVAMDATGHFIVAWSDDEAEFVDARRFDATGQPLGNTFRVSQDDNARGPQIAADANGGFVLIWRGSDEVFARRYSANGEGTDRVTVYRGQSPTYLHVTTDADGDYAAIWRESSATSSSRGVYLRRYIGPEDIDLAARLVATNESVPPGGSVSYRLTIDNNHDSVSPVTSGTNADTLNRAIGAATGISAEITLPASLTDIDVSNITAPAGRTFECTATATSTLTCGLNGALYAGESIAARITARADDQLQTLQANVSATADQFDSNEASDTGNNGDSATITIAESSGDTPANSGGGDDDDGGSGGGCTTAENSAFDPTFIVLLALAGIIIARRRRDQSA
ncbi:VBCS repeat-containing protein [Salinisphaera shabanensis T35B1]